MYSLGTSFVTTTANLISSFGDGEIIPTMSTSCVGGDTTIFAAPVTIDLKLVCTFCENPFELLVNGLGRSREMRQLEEIATEHFKRQVLKVGEENLADYSPIFPDDGDGTRCKRLLGSVTLCNRCIFHFARTEQRILKDQLEYLEKLSGAKNLEDIFADPWLDIKRLIFHKLKCQEITIKEKLELMQNVLSRDHNEGDKASTSCSTSTYGSLPTATTTTAQQSSNDDNQVNNAIVAQNPPQQNLQTATVNGNSKMSSRVGSPKPADKEHDNSNDSTNFTEQTDDDVMSNAKVPPSSLAVPAAEVPTSTSLQQQEENDKMQVDENNQENSQSIEQQLDQTEKATTGAGATENDENEEGNNSEAESLSAVSVRSSRSAAAMIPVSHMSPIVRLRPLSVSKNTPPPPPTSTSKATGWSGRSNGHNTTSTPKENKGQSTSRKLIMDDKEIEDILNNGYDNDNTSRNNDEGDGTATAFQNSLSDADDESQDCGGSGGEGEQQEQNPPIQIEERQEEGKDDDENMSHEIIEKDSQNPSKESAKESSKDATEDPESSQELFQEYAQEDEDKNDSDESFVPTRKKKNKRKRNSSGVITERGGKRKKVQIKFDFAKHKEAKLSAEKELSLSSVSTPSKESVNPTPSSSHKNVPAAATPVTMQPTSTALSKKSTSKKKKSLEISSNTAAAAFVTPNAPCSNGNSNSVSASVKKGKKLNTCEKLKTNVVGNGSDAGRKTKSLSVVNLAREKIGGEIMRKASRSTRSTTPGNESITPKSGEKTKKYFKIGNRYMTDPSSDSSEDSDDTYVKTIAAAATASVASSSDSE